MVEPLENYDAVIGALGLLTEPAPIGIGLSPKRITISTVGLVPQIFRLANEGHRYRLAISLHAATDDARSKLMPINRTFPLAQLMKAVTRHVETTGRRVTFEYILIEEINDSVGDASKLVRLVGQIPCKINVIPFHSIGSAHPAGLGAQLKPSVRMQEIVEHLRNSHLTVFYREIRAYVPLGETFGYTTVLRSLSQGKATHSMEFDHYQEVPSSLLEQIAIKAKGRVI